MCTNSLTLAGGKGRTPAEEAEGWKRHERHQRVWYGGLVGCLAILQPVMMTALDAIEQPPCVIQLFDAADVPPVPKPWCCPPDQWSDEDPEPQCGYEETD